MELHQLRYFIAVAETGGFVRAAQRCGVTQPSLSQQIRKLEDELGVRLFDRSSRGAVPTEAGRALLPRAQRILAEVRDTVSGVKEDIEAGRGPLSVGAIPTIAPYLMPQVLSRFLDEHQGTYVLAALREAGCGLPVVMSYDFDSEPRRWTHLEKRYAPIQYLTDNADPQRIRAALRDAAG